MANYKNKDLKIVIDDIALGEITQYEVSLDTYDVEAALMYQNRGRPNAKVCITGVDFRMEVRPETMKTKETQEYIIVYLYGVLEKVFPGLFKDLTLNPWQKAYVETQTSDLYERSKIWKDNAMFTHIDALWFKKGWDARNNE